jgi:hypothetical protein
MARRSVNQRQAGAKSLLDRKGRDQRWAHEQVIIIKELCNTVKEQVPLALRPNNFIPSNALAFLDIPDDVRVDAVAFPGAANHPARQRKEARAAPENNLSRQIRRLLIDNATHF